MTERAILPASLVGRMTLWALLLFTASMLAIWALFAAAAGEVSRQVVDTRLIQFADQVRGYWASLQAGQSAVRPRGAEPSSGPVLGSPDVGWVWQILVGDKVLGRSQLLRLSGTTLKARVKVPSPEFSLTDVDTAQGPMRIAERIVDEALPYSADGSDGVTRMRVHYLVGINAEQYENYVAQHTSRLRRLFVLAAIPVSVAILGMLVFIVLALRRDLARVSASMGRYEEGETPNIEGVFPRELQRLVDRMNGLLQQNMLLIDRTRRYVSKIAHDINHPLAVMKNDLQGRTDADLMQRQVDRMAGLVDRYSSLARAIGPEGQIQRQTNIGDVLDDVANGFSILYRRTPLEIVCDCEPELTFPVAQHDLEAMLSNLVSNAHKFAKSEVRLSATCDDKHLRVIVEDDGPGIPEAQRNAALNWGGRLDEAPPGTGFGLTIVRDITALYGGEMRFADSLLGGLKAELILARSDGT